MNEFLPLADYDYTFLGVEPEEWIDDYVADMDVDELEDAELFDLMEDIEV